MKSRYIDSSDHSDAYAPDSPTTMPDQQCRRDRAPEAADAAQHDDQERRHHRIDADVRTDAPDRRHDDAGDRRERDAQREHEQPQSRRG